MTLTEADLFNSETPAALLREKDITELEALFGPIVPPPNTAQEYRDRLLDMIWKKYTRIDFIKWDPEPDDAFYDYVEQKYVSLDKLNEDFNSYSLMALSRLKKQLLKAYNNWPTNDKVKPFYQLIMRIKQEEAKFAPNYLKIRG